MPYINKISITNIRSITSFQMDFEKGKEAGWHVLIGDNGSGKTTVLRAIAAGLIGEERSLYVLQPKVEDLIRKNETSARIEVAWNWGRVTIGNEIKDADYKNIIEVKDLSYTLKKYDREIEDKNEHFHCAISLGSHRRFTGGEGKDVDIEGTKAEFHRTLFSEKYVLESTVSWLKKLDHQQKTDINDTLLKDIIYFINQNELLPNGVFIQSVTPNDIILKNQEGLLVTLNDISDGYRSVLSLVLEIIRLLHKHDKKIDFDFEDNDTILNKAIVLIDEIDAHLHPTWQTKIGEWFTQYFPNVQFIVTTHSPLICRACGENGSIWRLKAANETPQYYQITGAEREKLVYADILEAYDTDVFGENVERNPKTQILIDRYVALKSQTNLNAKEQAEMTDIADIIKQVYETLPKPDSLEYRIDKFLNSVLP